MNDGSETPAQDLTVAFAAIHGLLNQGDNKAIADLMADWHPAILGQMLLAIAEAKRRRYIGPHPWFSAGVKAVTDAANEQRR